VVFIAALAAAFLGILTYLVLVARLASRLRVSHTTTWESLGSFSLFSNNTPRNGMLLLRWLWNRDYGALDDAATIRLASLVRALLLVELVCLAIAVIAYVALGTTFSGNTVA
jgi:hypothetical protein